MTVEIAVMNKMGVALAADSAVTINSGRKIFHSANKLFMLSKYHPVGVMIYNNSLFLGCPWEVLIKEYRACLGDKPYATIEEYGNSFIEWLKSSVTTYDLQGSDNLFREYVSSAYYRLAYYVGDVLSSMGLAAAGSNEAIKAIVEREISSYVDSIRVKKKMRGVPKEFQAKAKERYSPIIDKMLERIFDTAYLTNQAKEILREYPIVFLEHGELSDLFTGVVIAGYGSSEIYPRLIEYTVDGYFLGWLRHTKGDVKKINDKNGALIRAYAQNDVVTTFMEGADPIYDKLIEKYVYNLLHSQYPKAILAELKTDDESAKIGLEKRLQETAARLMHDFSNVIKQHKNVSHIWPVMGTIRSLPRDELAVVAETLANLTSFKRKVSPESETVGGPIDVCVISKGDGFVWIKRKHYFKPELNRHFFDNYFRDKGGEGTNDNLAQPQRR